MVSTDVFFILRWWTIITLMGIIFLPLTSRFFNSFFDKGYIFSKILGICVVTYIAYALGSFNLLSFSNQNLLLIIFFCIIGNAILFHKTRPFKLKDVKIFIFEEFLFLACLLFWSLIRSYNPSIHDLEKFMDYGFINSILRSEFSPPKDMWLTPETINYYYFGHLFTAVLTKISGIPAYITFNLMIASIFAFCFTSSFSLGINLIKELKVFALKKIVLVGFIFGYVVSLSGNLQPIYSLFKSYQGGEFAPPFWTLVFSPQSFPNSYWYPNATRFIYHTIHEFPSYSFVVADLHGHVLSIPIVLILIALSFVLFLEKKSKIPILILSSFFLSAAYMTNAWDGIIYLGLFINILFFLELAKNKEKKLIKKLAYSILRSAKYVLTILVLLLTFSFIFNQSFSPFASGIGLICSPDFLVEMKKLGPFVFEEGQCEHSPIWQLIILYGLFIFMTFSFFLFIRKKKILKSDGFVLIISFFSLLLIIIPEFFYLKDIYSSYFRANTMFKLSYQAFIMLSLASVYIFIRITSSFKKEFKGKLLKTFFFIFIPIAFILLTTVSIYPYFSIPSGYGDLKIYKGLHGTKYLEESRPGDFLAINWINQNIKKQPVILEAQGDSYTDFARISSNTGLPTVLGWTVHEWLWRGSYDIPSSRFDDIKALYETDETYTAKKIIDKYKISYIYIGGLEKEKYKVSEEKFSKLGTLIYSNNETNIYEID